MKMVKSLLLGSAAGLVAVVGAQAADYPVKAKPVEYVKVCSLYGEGFYYIPGTETCIKLGGYLRVQLDVHAGAGGQVFGDGGGGTTQAMYDRVRNQPYQYRIRAVESLDVRSQSSYGTVRGYFRLGIQQTTPADSNAAPATFMDRAFIQFAGFTVGKAQSFYDTVTYGGAYSFHNVRTVSDTGASGWNVWAYTAQFGNGISGTLSFEDPMRNRTNVDNTAGVAAFPAAITTDNTGAGLNGFHVPDIIGNLRIDQTWGYVSASVAAHQAAAAYYLTPNNVNNGHPSDKWGYAVSIGALLNVPVGGYTDKFGINFQWSEGASGYGAAIGQVWSILTPGQNAGWGFVFDGIHAGIGTEIELTRVSNFIAFYEHIWTPQWKTSWFGGYVQVSYTDRAKSWIIPATSAAVCPGAASPTALGGVVLAAGNSCNPDWSFYQVGSRTMWNPERNLDIGLEVVYTRLNTAFKGPAAVTPGAPQNPVTQLADQDVYSIFFRWQRNFWP